MADQLSSLMLSGLYADCSDYSGSICSFQREEDAGSIVSSQDEDNAGSSICSDQCDNARAENVSWPGGPSSHQTKVPISRSLGEAQAGEFRFW